MHAFAMTTRFATLAVLLTTASCATPGGGVGTRAASSTPDKAWTFASTPTWQDEFDYSGKPDPAKWGYDLGGHGWGNNELQFYTDSADNAFVRDGVLHIVARRESRDGRAYTSTRLISKGKGDFLYGRFEVRAKLPSGRGTWPAIWMLPTDWKYGDWPRSGEIDIMEHVGFDPERVHISVHTQAYNHVAGTQRTATRIVDGVMEDFHLYSVDWTPESIRGYIDDIPMFAFANEGTGPDAWPFDQRFHFLLNVAVGGNWGGKEGVDDSVFPATLQVDYVRAYELLEQAE